MTRLVDAFEGLLQSVRQAFPQRRTFAHARSLAYGFAAAWGRRTIRRALCATHSQFRDWSSTYRFFSRSPWQPKDVFQPILARCLAVTSGMFVVAIDDTSLRKTGRHIPGVSYLRDPMSARFAKSFIRGQRFVQAAAVLRPEGQRGPARTIPVRFHPAPPPKRPGRRAEEDAWRAYRQAQRTENLSAKGAFVIRDLRESMDRAGHADRTLLVAVDGSYCNRNVMRELPQRTEVVARARGDMRLYAPLTEAQREASGRRQKYGDPLPRPNEVLADESVPWRTVKVYGAGRVHDLVYKAIPRVLWRNGTRDRAMRLFVIRPLRYRARVGGPLLYRDPAYLLTTDLTTPDPALLQAYFDRWAIEVNHRDEKDLLGVGQAQVGSEQAAWRVPQFQVAVYAILLLAALTAFGPKRTEAYLPQPKWRTQPSLRPSTLDILALLREELMEVAVANMTGQRPDAVAAPWRGRVPRPTPPSSTRLPPDATRPASPVQAVVAALYASG